MQYRTYVISTVWYGIFGIIAVFLIGYFLWMRRILLAGICGMIALVVFDNFFSAERLGKTGHATKKNYVIPPFLLRKR